MSIKRSVTFARLLSAIGFSRSRLSSSVSRLKSSVTFSSIRQAVIFARLQSQVILGKFIKLISLSDTASVSDQESKSVVKSSSDSASMNDDPRKTLNKILDEIVAFAESVIASTIKPLTDSASADDDTQVGISKPVSDTFTANDTIQPFQFAKNLDDTVRVTDDVGGEASVDDDQTIAFFKVRSDSGSVSDSEVKLLGKGLGDGASAADSGSFIVQGYVTDPTYFADDYVGTTGSF